MLDHIHPENILFIDIETVPQYADFSQVPENFQALWEHKSAYFRNDDQTAADVYQRAGIYAEFGRIICISTGYLIGSGAERRYRVKSFFQSDEKSLLAAFTRMLEQFTARPGRCLCAHNGQEFDYPYIARRSLINGLQLPSILDIAGMKPWEVRDKLIDTLQLWKFGDYKNYTSLNLLCAAFHIPTPKDDIDGSEVARVFYQENNPERIARYCEKDTLAAANLFLSFRGEPYIPFEHMQIA